MNIKKIEKQLKRINQLFENIKEDGIISPIERDLMLSYVRSLYEKVLEADHSGAKESKSESYVSKNEDLEKSTTEPDSPTSQIANAVFQDVVEEEEPIAPKVEAIVQEEKVIPQNADQKEIPEELSQLFMVESTKELSDKLSRAPISDLTKSMGINEKIFTVQELFGGDSALFNKTMESLDKMTSLEQAKDFLVDNIAIKQNWTAEGKVKKAAHFIKLISRRY